ncbi:FERM domain-containing protein 3-like isoform X1 [Dreissena polymorpha]|uniref:FERM domain-containing protein 3-like isoform X1 n=1 Tax=Dreissena polymorpha TaxID=45954 RepID=UPI002263CF79|nr:FERM domain-containing protein 3-like isoform X1 [Dreissena polymorpha]
MTLFRKSKSKGDLQQEFQTTVRFLDDSEPIQLSFTKETTGQFVLDKVCETLNLLEKDYFGLRYVDAEKQRHWLDPTKTVYRQLKGVSPCVLCFRVKFYPAEPMKLHEEITRYYLFLQLRRDLHHGRLLCSPQDANLLAAYIIQSEVGDYHPEDHPAGYVAEFKMLPNQTALQEQQIHELHKTLAGQVPAEAEANFLKKAASLDTYGVDPHKVKDQKGNQMYLGVTHQGIMTFHGSRRTQIYKWTQIKKLAFEGKTFIAHVNVNEDVEGSHSKKKHQPIGYKCITVAACKYLWKCAVEQQFFFTLQTSFNSPKVRSGGSLFSRGSKFRFSGRCQNEAYSASEDIKRKEPDFQRTCSLPNFARKSDSKIHMRNSANISEANTLPHMTSVPTVSVQPENFEKRKNSRGSQENEKPNSQENKSERQNSLSRRKSRESQEKIKPTEQAESPIAVDENAIKPLKAPGLKAEVKTSVPVEVYHESSVKQQTTQSEAEPKANRVVPPAFNYIKPFDTETKTKPSSEPKPAVSDKILTNGTGEPVKVEENVQRDAESFETEHPKPFVGARPKLKEIGRYTTKEVMRYTEVEQRETVIGPESVIVPTSTTEAKLESKIVTLPVRVAASSKNADVKVAHKENAVDVPNSVKPSATPGTSLPGVTETPVVEEEMTQLRTRVEESIIPGALKINGAVPMISVMPPDSPPAEEDDMVQPYNPNVTTYEDDDIVTVPQKSLEEQLKDLEIEAEEKQENHVQPVAEPKSQAVKPLAPSKRGCSCCKVFAFTFFSLFLTFALCACVVMFSNVDHPIMNEARARLPFLEPTRDFILHKFEDIKKKL